MRLLILFLLLTNVRTQQFPCLCSCCDTQMCNPIPLPTVYVDYCTLETCLAQCRATYSQCQKNHPFGQISVQCESSIPPQFNCQCNCCNTGSVSCSPSYIGNSLTYSCQTAACSIACNTQYPYQCVSNQNGQTQGICTNGTSGNVRCKCRSCNSTACNNYEFNTNEGCAMCYSLCRQHTLCDSNSQVTHICQHNNTNTLFPSIIFILIMIVYMFFL